MNGLLLSNTPLLRWVRYHAEDIVGLHSFKFNLRLLVVDHFHAMLWLKSLIWFNKWMHMYILGRQFRLVNTNWSWSPGVQYTTAYFRERGSKKEHPQSYTYRFANFVENRDAAPNIPSESKSLKSSRHLMVYKFTRYIFNLCPALAIESCLNHHFNLQVSLSICTWMGVDGTLH